MIKNFSLTNFKSFSNLERFELNSLTIVAGKNSCGKSSILQSLLLLKQTLNSASRDVLVLDGEHLVYSNLKEIAHNLPPVNRASVSYKFEMEVNDRRGEVEFCIANKKRVEHYQPEIKYFKTTVIGDNDSYDRVNFSKLRFDVERSNFFPKQLLPNIKGKISIKTDFMNFIPFSVLASFSTIDRKLDKLKERNLPMPLSILYPSEDAIIDDLSEEIRNIKYLGPVRATPKRAYVHFSEAASELLPSGENAAHVLWARQNERVNFGGKEVKLKDALNECINIIGLSQFITPSRVGDLIYKINLSQKNCQSEVSISDVGFGYSQVIPIILLCLLSKKQNLIILEQPEIHLHPSSAANLADLFVRFIKDGRRILIETHSSELISRLRLRVIEDPELQDKITISFVESDGGNIDSATFRQFNFDEKGMFPIYPEGFLDESDKISEAIIKARVQKNKIKKQSEGASNE